MIEQLSGEKVGTATASERQVNEVREFPILMACSRSGVYSEHPCVFSRKLANFQVKRQLCVQPNGSNPTRMPSMAALGRGSSASSRALARSHYKHCLHSVVCMLVIFQKRKFNFEAPNSRTFEPRECKKSAVNPNGRLKSAPAIAEWLLQKFDNFGR